MPNPSPLSTRVASCFLAILSLCMVTLVTGCNLFKGSSGGNGGNGGPGQATKLVFTSSPGGASAGTAFVAQPVVNVEDANGNTVTSSTASVTLAITNGTGTNGATLSCTANTVAAVAGVATFAGCKINLTGVNYTLSASSAQLTTGVSPSFGISPGNATQLSFTAEPQSTTVNTNMAGISVAVKDAQGNTVTTNNTVSIALVITSGTGAAGATLACSSNTVTVSSGVANFTNCKISTAGTGYTLTATSAQLTSAVSSSFNINSGTVGAASKVVFTTSPSGGSGAALWTTQPVVAVQDASGNTVTTGTGNNASITLSITSGTGATGATLTCSNKTVTASSGVATFAGCQIDLASGGYTLTATSSGLTNGVSASFSITVGSAAKLGFTAQPGGGTGGVVWGQQPVVAVQDAGGNTVTGGSAQIMIGIVSGTGNGILTCSSGTTLNTTAGVASFAGCKINVMGNGYALSATAAGLTSVISSAFDVAIGPAARLVFATEPSGAVAGTPFTAQPMVLIKDAGGDNIPTSSAAVTLTLTSGPGTLTCTGSNTLTASAGVAIFAGCQISAAGMTDVLTATSGSLTLQSTAFVVETTPGSAAKLAFTVEPTNTESGITLSPSVQVTIEDSNGVPVTSATNQISLTLNNPGSATLGGGGAISPSGGTATFSGLAVSGVTGSTAGTAYTLQASANGLTSATSTGFRVFTGQAPTCSGAPNGSEFLMQGNWAALVQGWNGTGEGDPLHTVFAISTDGAGGLNNLDGAGMGGQFDRQNGAQGAASLNSATIEQAGSSYVIGQDPTSSGYVGCMTLAVTNGSGGTAVHFWFALGGITGTGTAARASKAAIIRWDDPSGTGGRGTGVILPQDKSMFSLGSLSANYAFGLRGVDPSGGPFAEAGAMTLNPTTGALNFQFDYDDAGSGGLVTGGTGTVSAVSNLTGRTTVISTVTINGTVVTSNAVWYIVNNNEFFHLSADPFSTVPIASGRGIVATNHGSFPPISGNFMVHLTGTSTVSSGGGCMQLNVLVDCAAVNLVAVTATPNSGTQTSSISGFSWEYVLGATVTPDALSGITSTVDATSGRLSFSGGNAQQAPVFYLATPQTGADATEPYVGFGAGSGTAGNIDPSALSGFVEIGASTDVSQSAIAGNYFFYAEMPGDNYVTTSVGVANVSSSGTVTGTQYAQSGSAGLQSASLSSGGGSSITVTNKDPVVSADIFPGIANIGPGSFGLTNGKRFVFFDEGSSGNSNAQFTVVDQK